MKRSAENQLTKDSREDDDELVEEGTGFKAASQEALAGRKIKGLPKRKGVGATPTASTPSEGEAPKPVFGGFAGFGSTPAVSSNGTSDSAAAKPSPFSGFGGFGASTANAGSTVAPTAPSSLFGTTTSSPSKTSQLFGASIAAASSSLSQSSGTTPAPAFTFKLTTASSTSDSSAASTAPSAVSFAFGGPPSSTTAAAAKSSSSSNPTSNDASVEYFLSLRGLNNSLLAAIESAIAKDPFAKLPMETIAAAYTKHQSDIEAKAKGATSTDVEMKPPAAEPAKPTPPNPTAISTPAPSLFSMPKPPSGGFSFGAPSSGAASTSSTNVPSFSFGAKPSEPSSNDKSNSSNALAFSFKPPSGGFTFGSQTTTTTPLFGAKADSTTPSSTATPMNLFGGANLFGASKPKEAESDSKKADEKYAAASDTSASKPSLYPFSAFDSKSPTPTPVGPKPNPQTFFSFGSTPATTPTQTPGTPDPAEKKPAFSFGFGPGKTGSFTFGAATPGTSTPSSGSLGNPVGFSFGAPKDTMATGAVTPTPSTTAGLEAAKAAHDPNLKPDGSTASVISETPADSPAPAPEATDIVGAGEENEDTLISERGKAYKLKDGSWTDIGTGNFKIKKDRETGVTRVLMRPEHGGNIILNFRFHPDLNPRPGQKPVNLTLVAFENGKPLNIVMRFTSGDATQRVLTKLKEVLEAS